MRDNYLIIGGGGFIGTNLAHHYLAQGKQVTILDNFSRVGAEQNVLWLQQRYRDRLAVVQHDIRWTNEKLPELAEESEVVFHLAAQVAVTTSVADPRQDFEINALGTLNVLEAVRRSSTRPIVIYSSTNKVYGKMADIEVIEGERRYTYANLPDGVPETRPLEFYSPYGCSKGCGDQYVIDYARIFGLQTVVFRQSCIYGPHQFGIEDQGWVAWFAIRAMNCRPVCIYGDGKQVRDVLYVEDLVAAYDAAIEHITETSGQAYNIGGGPTNSLSLLELIDMLEHHFGRRPSYTFEDWRPGDQKVFISDIRKARDDFNWEPHVKAMDGVSKLVDWMKQNQHLFLDW